MAKSVSAALTAEQKKGSNTPHVEVKIAPELFGAIQPVWTRWYTGTETPAVHGATVTLAGTLHRLWRDPDGTPLVRYSRVTSPSAASDYDNWNSWGGNIHVDALSISAYGNVVIAVLNDATDPSTSMFYLQSLDDGATWIDPTPTTFLTGLTDVTALAVLSQGEDEAVVFYVDNGALKAIRMDAGVWGTPVDSGITANSFTGVNAMLMGDNHVVVTGTDGDDNAKVWTVIFGNGVSQTIDTWSTAIEIEDASAGTGVSFTAPFYYYQNNGRATFVEAFSGTVSHNQPMTTWFPAGQSFTANAWSEPVPFDLSTAYGICLTTIDDYHLSVTPDGVWAAPMPTDTDLTDDVLSVRYLMSEASGHCTIVLRNDDGRYNGLPSDSVKQDLRLGVQLTVTAGYMVNGQPALQVPGSTFIVDDWQYLTEGGKATLTLYCIDHWERLHRWEARRQHSWANGSKTYAQILAFIFARAGIELLNSGNSTHAIAVNPALTINPGEDGRSIVLRLLARMPDTVRISQQLAYLSEFTDSDSSAGVYGIAGELPIKQGRYRAGPMAANRARVFGASDLFAEQFDYASIGTTDDRASITRDLNMTSQALVEARAVIDLRKQTMARALGRIVTPVDVERETYDVVTITDEQAGIAAVDYRVLEVDWEYRRGPKPAPMYEMRLLLGAV